MVITAVPLIEDIQYVISIPVERKHLYLGLVVIPQTLMLDAEQMVPYQLHQFQQFLWCEDQ